MELFLLAVCFICTTFFEHFILVYLKANATRDHYISSTLLAIVIFIIFTDEMWNKNKLLLAKKIGKDYSSMIYIIHPIFITVLGVVATKIHVDSFYIYICPIIIYIVSIFVVGLYYKIKNTLMKLLIRRTNNQMLT